MTSSTPYVARSSSLRFTPLSQHYKSIPFTTLNTKRASRLRTLLGNAKLKSSDTTTTTTTTSKPPSTVTSTTEPSIPTSKTFLAVSHKQEGPSTDLTVIATRLRTLALPYWLEGPQSTQARWKLAGVFALTLGTTGVSVIFNFLGRDFFNALSAKDQATFTEMLFKWLAALCLGIPVFVLRDYYQSRLALDWRSWMTETFTKEYFSDRTFYKVQASALLDNPDQRIAVDVRAFTDTTLSFSVTLLNATVDLVSFSGILFSIYPPLFVALLVYSIGGTAASLAIGRPLVGLNFLQEAAEADFRYGLVRVRENAESIAFYGGEENEAQLLGRRLQAAIKNYAQLLLASRNLSFFTSFYRFLIQILPAAVVAPLFFRGEIEFGVINQSSSAFNHILTDVSLVVYQFEALAGFSAVVDRLGELKEVLDACNEEEKATHADAMQATDEPIILSSPQNVSSNETITALNSLSGSDDENDIVLITDFTPSLHMGGPLLELKDVSLVVPGRGVTLINHLDMAVDPGHSLLIMGPSGSGKTSLLRTIAGLWRSGSGQIVMHGRPMGRERGQGEVFFVPQRPYVVLGTLRDQLLYPTWSSLQDTEAIPDGGLYPTWSSLQDTEAIPDGGSSASVPGGTIDDAATADGGNTGVAASRPLPSDEEMRAALRAVQLSSLLERIHGNLDAYGDWAAVLSLGEQQRIAFARVLLARPRLVLMDESTSALDTRNEKILYSALRNAEITYVSVGHRPTLVEYHENVLFLHGDADGGWEVKKREDASLETVVAFMD